MSCTNTKQSARCCTKGALVGWLNSMHLEERVLSWNLSRNVVIKKKKSRWIVIIATISAHLLQGGQGWTNNKFSKICSTQLSILYIYYYLSMYSMFTTWYSMLSTDTRHSTHDTRCLQLNMQCSLIDTRFSLFNVPCLLLDSQCSLLNKQYSLLDKWSSRLNTHYSNWHSVFTTWHAMFTTWHSFKIYST